MTKVTSVGVVGGYPNGGFPAQAFYGVYGAGMSGSSASKASSSNAAPSSFSVFGASKWAVVITMIVLIFGGYILWHVSY